MNFRVLGESETGQQFVQINGDFGSCGDDDTLEELFIKHRDKTELLHAVFDRFQSKGLYNRSDEDSREARKKWTSMNERINELWTSTEIAAEDIRSFVAQKVDENLETL
eukprot:TRINITY_DN3810_c0_g1_i2.p1 TRINITY_DN3810_c0_g1~~TRINITY_DN3810_c0_g1_i2.p1  ORF type:complete len:109 (+),score=23.76 TRINITY_DN3810_c0_g1_i2:234-560(+)